MPSFVQRSHGGNDLGTQRRHRERGILDALLGQLVLDLPSSDRRVFDHLVADESRQSLAATSLGLGLVRHGSGGRFGSRFPGGWWCSRSLSGLRPITTVASPLVLFFSFSSRCSHSPFLLSF